VIEISNLEPYFGEITKKIDEGYKLATLARKKGYDPSTEVEIPLVRDMAERVEGLISVIAPQIVGKGLPERLKELEKEYGALDWRVSLVISLEIARQKFCKFRDSIEAMELGIRVGLAYITMGTVASPLEGFVGLKIRKRRDGKDYPALMFSGPIRSAGGTAASVTVLIADYLRTNFGLDAYDPTDDEIERTVTELYDYHDRVTNLQYLPSEEEIRFLVKRIPLQIDGDPSEKFEVSRFKDLERIETNTIRNGVCLVLGEGIAQKAKKLWKPIAAWGNDFQLGHWGFLQQFLELQTSLRAKGREETTKKVNPDYTFIKDLVAGRPVLTYPLRSGGFRLRYGRTRTSGYSSCAIHPATMRALSNYIAIGTQLKLERPGKGAAITMCDSIEGPVVRLSNGNVVQLSNEDEVKASEISEILYLGDILINYGDFFNRNHLLIPPGYCEEWWAQEFEKAIVDVFGSLDIDKCSEFLEMPRTTIAGLLKDYSPISDEAAFGISKKLNVPLHPMYTYFWNEITKEQLGRLLEWLKSARYVVEDERLQRLVLPNNLEGKRALELLAVPHMLVNNEFVVVLKEHARSLLTTLNVCDETLCEEALLKLSRFDGNVLEFVNSLSPVTVRDRSGIFIGARMGRPEKAKMRKMTGSPHVLFPVGDQGGKMRSFGSALEAGFVRAEFPMYMCEKCNKQIVFPVCDQCGRKTKRMYRCKVCGFVEKEVCPKHGKADRFSKIDLDIKSYFSGVLEKFGMKVYPDLIKGVRGTSNEDHTPEHLGKGILRAKHNVFVNKDGTIRYDMTQLPITHFKPLEIGTSIEVLRDLGYENDIYGKPLESEEQILELRPQDVILPGSDQSLEEGADQSLFRVAGFIDELLGSFYGLKPFYNLKSPKDLAGHLVVCLAPHTSAAIVGRIIGFTKTQGFFAHPLMHASTRRDCDGDEACVMLLLDTLINFSRRYLPAHRGSTQDAPLVLTTKVIPEEVDDMVFDMDIEWRYPLEFYNACLAYKKPSEVKIAQVSHKLKTENKYSEYGFTHNVSNLNKGVCCSAYKTLPSMEEKLKGQMELAEKIRAVDAGDVATLVIEKHFLKDTKGNLRKFSTQQFRCVNCNQKYRRPPLSGKCSACGSRIIFTVSEGSVTKYLEPSISLAKKYELPSYLRQSLELLKRRIEAVFGKEKDRQEGLGKWF
jgi:DNA polymerase II large subunit